MGTETEKQVVATLSVNYIILYVVSANSCTYIPICYIYMSAVNLCFSSLGQKNNIWMHLKQREYNI